MKSFTIATVLAIALPAFAQTVSDLPQCAQQPILVAISSSGCGLTDIPCICGKETFVKGLLEVIPTLCTPAETTIVAGFAQRLCAAADVTLSLPADLVSATSLSAPASITSTASSAEVTSSVATITSPVTLTSTISGNATTTAFVGTNSTSSAGVSASITSALSSLSRAASSTRAAASASTSAPAGSAASFNSAGLISVVGGLVLAFAAGL